MLRPEAEPGIPRHTLVERDDVHLRVVEQRALVEVRRADGQPAIVDDADLRVHVHGVAQASLTGVDRAREEACVAVVGMDEGGNLAARHIGAVVGVGG